MIVQPSAAVAAVTQPVSVGGIAAREDVARLAAHIAQVLVVFSCSDQFEWAGQGLDVVEADVLQEVCVEGDLA
jgi:hypothetical protein